MSTAVRIHQISKRFLDPVGPLGKRAARTHTRLSGRSLVQALSIAALDRVSFAIEEGEIFGLVGPGGSGKSTLLRLLAGLLLPDEGELQVFGYDAVRSPDQVQRLVNPHSMSASFFGKLSPVDNLLQGAGQQHREGGTTRQSIIALLSSLGMDSRSIHQPMETLDRSMQPLVSLARALFPIPRLLLLDEPMNGLEEDTWWKVQETLQAWRARYGVTILLTASGMQPLYCLCDRVAVLEAGRLSAIGAPDDLSNADPCRGYGSQLEYLFLGAAQPPAREAEKV